MVKCPCIDCDRRSRTCHDVCEEYKAWADVKRAVREAETRDRVTRQAIMDIHRRAVKRAGEGR